MGNRSMIQATPPPLLGGLASTWTGGEPPFRGLVSFWTIGSIDASDGK